MFSLLFLSSLKRSNRHFFYRATAILRQVCPIVKCGVRVWTVRGPELTWIVFQVGQQPHVWPVQPQELAQGCGFQRQQVTAGGHTVQPCAPGNWSKLHTGHLWCLMGFSKVGVESEGPQHWERNILFHLLSNRGFWNKKFIVPPMKFDFTCLPVAATFAASIDALAPLSIPNLYPRKR